MDYMIYIYAGIATVLTGSGWVVGFHFGRRCGYRDSQNERDRTVSKMMLNAQFGQGPVYDVNSLYPAELTQPEGEESRYYQYDPEMSEARHDIVIQPRGLGRASRREANLQALDAFRDRDK